MAASRTPAFGGRFRERGILDGLVTRVRHGESGVLVLRGEAGMGKTELLRYCGRQASGCRVVQIAGVESELELPLARVHELCDPVLEGSRKLPEPQQQALGVAFGLTEGRAPDRLIVALAVLSLLAEAAAERPLVCLVDDAQWLDDASSQVLGFVSRRLVRDSVLLVFAVRGKVDSSVLAGLPSLVVDGMVDDDARELLTAAVPGHLDPRVRDRLVAETRGNPLALLELSRSFTAAELAGGYLSRPESVSDDLHQHYVSRVRALPASTRRFVLLASADPTGDATLFWRAALRLGLAPEEAATVATEGLLEIGPRVRFRHPLVRSAAYAAARPEDRRTIHRALAAATDATADPDRRIWHLAAAADGPDESIAQDLERSASRARDRAGLSAAAAFLERATALSADPVRRRDRALAAARADLHAGALGPARKVLARADAEARTTAANDLDQALVERFRAQVEWASSPGSRAPGRLLQAAARLASLDVRLARDTYLDAIYAGMVAGRLAHPGAGLLEVCRAARSAPRPPGVPRPWDFLLDGLATMVIDGRDAAASDLRRGIEGFLRQDVALDDWLQWGVVATTAPMVLWDFDRWEALSARHVELARSSSALAPLARALNAHRVLTVLRGDLGAAASQGVEERAMKELTGTRRTSYGDLLLAAYRGRPVEAAALLLPGVDDALARGEGRGVQVAGWATSVLANGLGWYARAADAAEDVAEEAGSPVTPWVLIELVEAAVRTGRSRLAREAFDELSGTGVPPTDWGGGVVARSQALLNQGQAAEHCYAEAVTALSRTPLRIELARARLLYGEWLSRESRRSDARLHLHGALELFTSCGAEAFAERARRELASTGERVRPRVNPGKELTQQEEHIAQLAREGHTNLEIGAELFLSARTVEWHLRKVFTKLRVTSRKDLDDALAPRRSAGVERRELTPH